MESSERLELSFLSLPSMKILASLIAPDGGTICQSIFEGFDCPIQWTIVLKDMAEVTRNARFADCSATGSNNTQDDVSHSQHSPVYLPDISLIRHHAPSLKTSQTRSRHQQTTNSSSEDTCLNSPQTCPATDELRGNLLPSDTNSNLNGNSVRDDVLPSVYVANARCSSPTNTIIQSESQVVEQSPTSPTISINTRANSSPINSVTTAPSPSPLMIRRAQKLDAQLEAIDAGYIPDKDQYNDVVRRLYQYSRAETGPMNSWKQFGHMLGRVGDISSAVGIVYSLLSWEVFRWEEDRLVQDEGKTLLAAAKSVIQCIALFVNFSHHNRSTIQCLNYPTVVQRREIGPAMQEKRRAWFLTPLRS